MNRIRPHISQPQPMSITAISGTAEWHRLTPLWRRAFVIATENGFNLSAAVLSANAANKLFLESDVALEVERMLANPDFQAVRKMYTEPVFGTVARQS